VGGVRLTGEVVLGFRVCAWRGLDGFGGGRVYSIESSEKETNANEKYSGGGAHGGCFQDLEISENQFFHEKYDVDWLGPAFEFYDFSQQSSSFVRSTVVRTATFRRDLLLLLLNSYHIISAVTARQAYAQLEVDCLLFCALRDEHLSIDQPV